MESGWNVEVKRSVSGDNTDEIPMVKRYATYDTLPVANIIITECHDEVDGDKDGIRSRFMGMVRGFNRDFLQNSTPPGTIFHGRTSKEVPTKKIKDISPQYVSAFCAPHNCLDSVHKCIKSKSVENKDEVSQIQIVEGIHGWDGNEDFAYGMATSLYESLPSGQYAGDPVADSLAIVTRDNCAILALADGVSWGPKSKHASNCSVYGSVTYLCENIDTCANTKDVFRCILKAFENAQACIVEEDATLTTLCVAVVVQLQEKDKWCLCVVNVGDSYAYLYNKSCGVKEVTFGSHPIDEARDMRYSGGALGPADGYNPDLANLTCSLVTLDEGDIVFLCSDGISDNFDPAVAKFIPRFKTAELMAQYSTTDFTVINTETPVISAEVEPNKPRGRHQSLGNISQSVAINRLPDHLTGNVETPNKVIYFQFDKSGSENIVERELVHNYFPPGLVDTTIQSSSQNPDDNNISSNKYIKTHNTNVNNGSNSKDNTRFLNENNINIADIDKEIINFKNSMLSDGVELTPRERHLGSLEQMKEVINTVEFEPINQGSTMRAVDICAQIMNFVINRTAEKRNVLEQYPESEMNKLTPEERKICNQTIKKKLKNVPGKLDHASIVAYEVGIHCKNSPLKLDHAKSNPFAQSLREQKQSNDIKFGSPSCDNTDGRTSIPTRELRNNGRQAFSHFL